MLGLVGGATYALYQRRLAIEEQQRTAGELVQTKGELDQTLKELETIRTELTELQNEDQVVKNRELQTLIRNLSQANTRAVRDYDRILDLKEKNANVTKVETLWATILSLIAKNDYEQAIKEIGTLETQITQLEAQLAQQAALAIPTVATVSNTAPSSGYQRQRVETSVGTFVVSLVAADLGSTRVIVDTATNGNCANDCPVLSLSDYVSRSGGYAGINGSYFCPATYPSCADKKNSFDLLVMNKEKTYINSDNNVYSTNPAVIFSSGSIRFVGRAQEWGRDTSVDGVLSNFPLLLSGGEIRFTGGGEPSQGTKGNRSFVGNKGNTVYIGVVHGATVAEAAWAAKTLGLDNALNLDDGGSTALWSGGYKVGPGRALPNAIIFVRK